MRWPRPDDRSLSLDTSYSANFSRRIGESLNPQCPGGFIRIPPQVPHQEINALADAPPHCVLARSGEDPVVVNVDIVAENPIEALWRIRSTPSG